MGKFHKYAVVLFVLSILITISCSTDSKSLKVDPAKLDFVECHLGETKTIDIELTNKYGKTIDITGIEVKGSGDFSIVTTLVYPIVLANNTSKTISVVFDPATSGVSNGYLEITHTGSTKPKIIDMIGTGVPVARISLSDSSHNFGMKIINKTHKHVVTVTNNGTAALSVTTLTLTGANATYFDISSGDAPFDILPGGTHDFEISFSPVSINNYIAELNIDHNAVNENNPFIYSLSGEGVDLDPQITLSETSPWDFGSVATTIPTTLYLEMSNTGTDPLHITDAVLQTDTEFKIDGIKDENYNTISFPYEILVGKKIYLWIKFAPTAKTNYTDILKIDHDGTNENSPWNFEIKGDGRDETVMTFSYKGSPEQFQVPANVTTIKVEATGASGGDGYPFGSLYIGGKGGKVTATFTVTPNVIMHVYVGGEGKDGSSSVGGDGGWNGGGKGQFFSTIYCGAGGGGASDIRVGGTAFTDRIIVAGAGGGSGNGGMIGGEFGGNGGDLTGLNGRFDGMYDPMFCGVGGSQHSGGNAGTGGNGQAGSLGIGGDATNYDQFPGGGGGAGYYGGGGGYVGGGGGGSSYTNTSITVFNHTQGFHTGNGEIKIIY